MPTVLITGGTGLIGNRLSSLLVKKGYEVRWLSRQENLQAQYPTFGWNIQKDYINSEAFRRIDHIIHLAGANIVDKRWTTQRKKVIIDSRVQSTKLLAKYIASENVQLQSFVGGAAIGYYGNTGEDTNTVGSPLGQDFMAEICNLWEKSYSSIKQLGIRTPIIRIGLVLSTQGGALSKMLPSYKVRIGSYFGNGAQYYSWIHLDDVCNILIHAMETEAMTGIYNGVAPNPVSNKTLAQQIAKALNKKSLIMPVPALVMKTAMGEMAMAVLNSTKVQPKNLLDNGFQFEHPDLLEALNHLVVNKI
ncbi:MAG: TIGR01777 family protein [Aureispira sp.]|nr:TIGR01777 family protein [Aureispira sp.]